MNFYLDSTEHSININEVYMLSKLTVYFRVPILASESFPKTMLLLKTFSPDVVFTVTPVASPETSSWGLAAHTLAAVSAERPFVEAWLDGLNNRGYCMFMYPFIWINSIYIWWYYVIYGSALSKGIHEKFLLVYKCQYVSDNWTYILCIIWSIMTGILY